MTGCSTASSSTSRDVKTHGRRGHPLPGPAEVERDRFHRQCASIRIVTEPDQPVWTDGEYVGRTPVTVDVMPGALAVVVP